MSVTYAVLKQVREGNGSMFNCVVCEKPIKFMGRRAKDNLQVIVNVAVGDVWDHNEHFHQECYDGRWGEPENRTRRVMS